MSSKRTVVGLLGMVVFLVGWLVGQQVSTVSAQQGGKGPTWSHSFDLKARPYREEDWDKAKKYGIEVFKDEKTGNLIYISETGSISVVAGK
jgi:hypothetical protein